MPTWLSARWSLWRGAVQWGWIVIFASWEVLSAFFHFRDNFLPASMGPHLDARLVGWPTWVIGSLLILLAASLEGCYRRHLQIMAESRNNPLFIISARWGIGGDAYKDVTEIVRAYAVSGSVKIPASIGIFRDPYPQVTKKLTVVYSVARQWEVSVKESDNLVLPEPHGQEQGNLRQFQDAAAARSALFVGGLTDAESKSLGIYKSKFDSLPWPAKIALGRICEFGISSSTALQIELGPDGFGFADPKKTASRLQGDGFVEDDVAGNLTPKNPKLIGAIVSDWEKSGKPR